MTFRFSQQETAKKGLQPGFRKIEPLLDGRGRVIGDAEIRRDFRLFFGARSDALLEKFEEARCGLRELYGASIEIAQLPMGGMRLQCTLEFDTNDRVLDQDLNQRVTGMGFSLKLSSTPVTSGSKNEMYERRVRTGSDGRPCEYFEQRMVRRYIITASEASSQFDRAAHSVEMLLQLASTLRPALPIVEPKEAPRDEPKANVVPIESARSSKIPPKPEPSEPLTEGPQAAEGGKAS